MVASRWAMVRIVFPFVKAVQSLLDQVFILRVYAGGRFIKDDDRASFKMAPGDGDALLLSSGEGRAALSNHGVIAVRQGEMKSWQHAALAAATTCSWVASGQPNLILFSTLSWKRYTF